MRFLCDVHIPYKLIRYLLSKGCEAVHVNKVLSDKTSDTIITNFADENHLIIITKDADFKKTHLVNKTPKQLIKLNCGNSSTKQIIELFDNNWDTLLKAAERTSFCIESDVHNFYLSEDTAL